MRGLPALPANAVRFVIGRYPAGDEPPPVEESASEPDASLATDGRRGVTAALDLSLPAPEGPIDVRVRPWSGSFSGGCSSGYGCGSRCSSRRIAADPASVRVRVLRRDGSPAPHVRVRIAGASGETADDGSVTLVVADRGRRVAVAWAHGFLPAAAAVVVGADPEIVLREPDPRPVRVRVEDAAGRPVPGAWVRPRVQSVPGPDGDAVPVQATVAQMRGDLELLTPRTGPDGAVVVDAPAGTCSYAVTLGGAFTRVESAADDVRVVLVAPDSFDD